ncbi:sensor histidine kinase KdpD [Cupriavidus sp. AU9028]|uniref:sensor histidine kinase n=1 Tax=Cupriavidus sp. AU9028 TaxID=2871157 RepID=UPI001C97E8E7|nr:ATP-binding protein [Cupriavidus sp. AU9028]MBY4896690.1 sensor histidine kinase [Cupriavidus sp. AU9028]
MLRLASYAPDPGRHGLLRLRRLYRLRWGVLAGQIALLLMANGLAGLSLPLRPLLLIFLLQALFNALTAFRLRQHGQRDTVPTDTELMGQLLVDLTALSAILFFTGGATNPFVSFYLPALALAGAILPWKQAAALAIYALAGYTLMLFEYVPLHLHNPNDAIHYHLAGMWLNFVAGAIMIAVFVARLAGGLRERDDELNRARERLLNEARVEALNAQAATVAHEIGTPLATLAVIAGELRADAADPRRGNTPVRDYLPDLRVIEQQLALCRTILARLREDEQSTAQLPAGDWLPRFTAGWRLRHPQAALDERIAPDAAALPVDPARTAQMLTILLDNAARSHHAAGQEDTPIALTINVQRDNGRVHLIFRVSDRGTGIPAALRARLGEAPVASSHGGHGIGAYLAQSAAQQMGGRVQWQDREGGGTVAELRLPPQGTHAPAGRPRRAA